MWSTVWSCFLLHPSKAVRSSSMTKNVICGERTNVKLSEESRQQQMPMLKVKECRRLFQSHLAFGYRKIRLRKYTGWFLKCVRMPEICPPDWQKNIICGYDRLHITMNRPVILPSNKSWLLMVPIHPDTQP